MKPPHWWLGVPQVRASRPDRDWVVYPMLVGALLLLFVVWASGWSHPTTARADLAEPHAPRDVRATGSASDRAIGRGAATTAAVGAAPVQSMQLPDSPGGRERPAPRPAARLYLARLGDLGAVTGDRAIQIEAGALGASVGGAQGGSGYGFADRVRMHEITEERPAEYRSVGTGVGYGIGGGGGGMGGARAADVPRVQLCTPSAPEEYRTIIRRYLRRNQSRLAYCYEKQLLDRPSLAGTVETSFVIERDGSVTGLTADGVDPAVSSCIGDVIAAIEFPAMPVPVEVSCPLTLRLR